MIVFFYEKVRLKRGAWQTVSIVLLIAFLCAFFTLFDGFICQKEQDMESAYAVIPVTVVVSNLTPILAAWRTDKQQNRNNIKKS